MAEATEPWDRGCDVAIRTSIFGDVYFLMALQEKLYVRMDLRTFFGPETGNIIDKWSG